MTAGLSYDNQGAISDAKVGIMKTPCVFTLYLRVIVCREVGTGYHVTGGGKTRSWVHNCEKSFCQFSVYTLIPTNALPLEVPRDLAKSRRAFHLCKYVAWSAKTWSCSSIVKGTLKNDVCAVSLVSGNGQPPPGGRLNKKDGLTRYGDSHVKDKTS